MEAQIKEFNNEHVHENDQSEALRRICRAAFAHNKKNIISPCFASYLIQHDSRFYYSSDFCYCPLKDVIHLHNKQAIRGLLKFTPKGDCFFENAALNYLCRPLKLENVSLRDFTELYYTMYTSKASNPDSFFPYEPETNHFKHPSVIQTGSRAGKCAQGVMLRDTSTLIQVSQWMFPDTAEFKSNLLTCNPTSFTTPMEVYSQNVLSFFLPHRLSNDLTIDDGS